MPRGENTSSLLLSRDENELVFSLIGPKCQSLATAVVQLFTTEGPAHSEWKKRDTGVLCLIKDNGKRSYFFRIYCLYRKAMIWEHEVYIQIEYKCPRPYLHTFEAEDYMTAFNFANEDEAKILRNILIEKIEFRKQRREERRRRSELCTTANNAALIQNYTGPGGGGGGVGGSAAAAGAGAGAPRHNGTAQPPPPPPVAAPPRPSNISNFNNTLKASKKSKARKLTKADIGAPKDFKHLSHVGWDANKGFDVDVENLPEEEMRSFFSKAGVSENQLQDRATRQFIYEFINSHGGLDAVKEELQPPPHRATSSSSGRAPPPPASPAPAPPAAPPPPAPPVPSRSPAPAAPALPAAPPSRAPPPPPARAVPPAPPPPAPRAPPPPRPDHPPSAAPPCAPPPPPPPATAPPPPPPPAPLAPPPPAQPAAPVVPDVRAALMESIRSGNKNLKHVDVASKPSGNEDNRSNLLSEIRQGIELRSVPKEASNPTVERRAEASGLAGALARALQERSRAIHSSDSDLSDETTSGGEWDD